MNIDSIYFKGYSCFKNEWAGFDTIKPINVIIGRNNSGNLIYWTWLNRCAATKPFRNGLGSTS